MKYLYNLSCFLIISIIFSYEPTTITGSVVDKNNNPIEHVSISSESDHFYTDKNGNFILLYNPNDILKFKKIGYSELQLQIDPKKTNLKIILLSENIKLNEITISEISGNVKNQDSTNDIHTLSEYDVKPGDIHFDDIINKVPNLGYAGGTSRSRFFQIRGIGERSQYAGEGGPNYYVATIIDDIDLSGIGMAIFLDDIKQIEVYQGPQSFSYGHNAMAGLINIKTKDPDMMLNKNLKITFGNDKLIQNSYYHQYKPLLNNKLFANLFFYNARQNGFMYNDFLNDYKNKRSEELQKLKLLYKPSILFNSKITLIHSNLNNGYDIWTPNNNQDTTYSNQPGKDSQELIATSIKNKYQYKKFKIIHISNFLKSDMQHSYDSDWANDTFWSEDPYNTEGYEYFQNELRQRIMTSHELRFVINASDKIKNALGVYFKDLEEDDNATGWILGGEDVALNSEFKITNQAFYNEFKYSFKSFVFTVNGRIEKVNLRYNSIHYHEEYDDNYNSIYDTTYINTEYDNILNASKISILYSIDKKRNLYLTLSNGFKAGGVNQNPRLADHNRLFKPEFNQNIDLGYKFKNKNTSLNINAFYMNRKDLQLSLSSQQDNSNPNSFYFYTSNASNGFNYGLSMNFKAISNSDFETYVNLGYLKTQINSYTYLIDESTTRKFETREAAHAPSYSLSWGFSKYYSSISIGGNVQAKDRFYFSDSHNQQSKAYSIANMHISYMINSHLNISLWSKNIFNTKYATRGFFFGLEPPNYEDKLYLSYGEPFTIGITLNYNF